MKDFFQTLLDSLFPKKVTVEELEKRSKKGGLATLPPSPETPHSWIRALFAYKDSSVRQLVWEIKYLGNQTLIKAVGQLMADEIISFFEERGAFVGTEWCLVPIPASKSHEKEKGFNQTEELCKIIIKSVGNPSLIYLPRALTKVSETKPQATIHNRGARLKNVKGSYAVQNPFWIKNKNIIVIDDVVTTGSTLVEAKRALKSSGAQRVIALTVAH